MLTIKYRLLLLAMFFPFALMAKNLKLNPGYYLNQQGDTVKCNIELKDWTINPSIVQVVSSNGSLELRPEEIKGFGVYGYADYISAQVTYHSATITGTDFPEKFSDKVETNWRFLKLLTRGTVSLYGLKTNERNVFFISAHGADPSELLYRVARKENHLLADDQYQQTLLALFDKERMGTKYNQRIEQSAYTEGDLLSAIKILNGGSTNYSYQRPQAFEIFAIAGGLGYLFPSSFDGVYSKENHVPAAPSPLAGIGLFYNLSQRSGKVKIGFSAAYSGYKLDETTSGIVGRYISQNYWDTTSYVEHFHSSNALFTLNIFLMYVINPGSTVKYYVKTGGWYSFSTKTNTGVYSDYKSTTTGIVNGLPPTVHEEAGEKIIVDVSNSFGNILVGGGVSFGSSQVDLTYGLPAYAGHCSGIDSKFRISTLSLTYGYLFGRKHSQSKRQAEPPQ